MSVEISDPIGLIGGNPWTSEAISEAVAGGARLLSGGGVPAEVDAAGCWLQPTLIDHIDEGHVLRRALQVGMRDDPSRLPRQLGEGPTFLSR